jgi:hypothetical protein
MNNTLVNDQWIIEETREKTCKFPENKENENTTYHNIWDTVKAVCKKKVYSCKHLHKKNTKKQKSQINSE